jgi:hypothetical protein
MTLLEETQAQALQDIKEVVQRDENMVGIRAPRELRGEIFRILNKLDGNQRVEV